MTMIELSGYLWCTWSCCKKPGERKGQQLRYGSCVCVWACGGRTRVHACVCGRVGGARACVRVCV